MFSRLLRKAEKRPGMYLVAQDRGGQLQLYVTADRAEATYRDQKLVVREGNRLATEEEYQKFAAACREARAKVQRPRPGQYGDGTSTRRWRKLATGWATK